MHPLCKGPCGNNRPQGGKSLPPRLPRLVTTCLSSTLTRECDYSPMRGTILKMIAGMTLSFATQVEAKSALAIPEPAGGGPSAAMPGVLQCVPFARDNSGIRLYGDAHTWWGQAAGKYARGNVPLPGAVMAIRPHGGSTLGHVAMVNRVVNARTILISHANWSAPGKIERNVTATDVSPANDWSEVRVWYAPIRNLGGGHWPVSGFIYNAKSSKASMPAHPPSATFTRFVPGKAAKVRFGNEPQLAAKAPLRLFPGRSSNRQAVPVRLASPKMAKLDARRDPIGAIIARNR